MNKDEYMPPAISRHPCTNIMHTAVYPCTVSDYQRRF